MSFEEIFLGFLVALAAGVLRVTSGRLVV